MMQGRSSATLISPMSNRATLNDATSNNSATLNSARLYSVAMK